MQVRVTTTAIPASVDTQTESIGSSWRSRNGFHLYLFLLHLPVAMAFLAYLHSDRCISGNAAPFGQLTVQTSCLFAVRDTQACSAYKSSSITVSCLRNRGSEWYQMILTEFAQASCSSEVPYLTNKTLFQGMYKLRNGGASNV